MPQRLLLASRWPCPPGSAPEAAAARAPRATRRRARRRRHDDGIGGVGMAHDKRLPALNGALGLIVLLLVVQMWLLTATLESYLAGHEGDGMVRRDHLGRTVLGVRAALPVRRAGRSQIARRPRGVSDMEGPGPIRRFLADDHDRLDVLLRSAVTPSGEIDLVSYQEFRAGLLRHIGIEEKILFPASQRARERAPPSHGGAIAPGSRGAGTPSRPHAHRGTSSRRFAPYSRGTTKLKKEMAASTTTAIGSWATSWMPCWNG